MGVLIPWALAIGFQTARDVRSCNRPPVPAEFVASGGLFTALSILATSQPQLASVLSWGILLALAFQLGPGALTASDACGGKAPTKAPAKSGGPGR